MSRVNVGVNPKYLADQHLIAESVEITMITGSLRVNNYRIIGYIPDKFKLNKGHMNFFKNKLLYLQTRLNEINNEMLNRNFKPIALYNKLNDLSEFPIDFVNNWQPTIEDSLIVRNRIVEKLNNKPFKFWRYNGSVNEDDKIKNNILFGELYYV